MSRARSLVLAPAILFGCLLTAAPALAGPPPPAGWTDGYVIGQRHPPALLAHRRSQAGAGDGARLVGRRVVLDQPRPRADRSLRRHHVRRPWPWAVRSADRRRPGRRAGRGSRRPDQGAASSTSRSSWATRWAAPRWRGSRPSIRTCPARSSWRTRRWCGRPRRRRPPVRPRSPSTSGAPTSSSATTSAKPSSSPTA